MAFLAQSDYSTSNALRFMLLPKFLSPADANRDGKVDGVDYIIWLNHYNTQTLNEWVKETLIQIKKSTGLIM